MTSDPIPSGPAFEHGELRKTNGSEPTEGAGARPDARPHAEGISIELSSLGRTLAERIRAEGPPGLEISAERLRAIADRLASGYYNSPEVRDQLAQSILNELRGG